MAFADIFKDDKTFPDTLEFTLPSGEKATLAEIRELTRTQQKSLAADMERLSSERKEAKELAEAAANIKVQYEALMQNAPKEPAKPDDFEDPWWAPVRSKLTPLQDELKQVAEAQKALKTMVEQAAMIFAQERWKGQYASKADRLKTPKYSDWTFEKVREYAANNKILDEYGIPAVDKAIETLTREDELERIKAEAREEGRREGATKARLGQMPRPTSASGAGKGRATTALDPTKNFEDLGDAVADDRELTEMVAQLQGLNMEDFLQ